MTAIFKNIHETIRAVLAYVYHNIKYYAKTSKNFSVKEENYAVINIDKQFKNDDSSRYFYMLGKYFEYSGFRVVIKTHYRDFSKLSPPFVDLKPLILKQNYTFVRSCSTPLNTVVLVQPHTTDHIIHLSYGYNNIIQSAHFDCIAPYPMYALQYNFYSNPELLEAIKKPQRTMKIFFSGGMSKRSYHSVRVNKFFNVMRDVKY